MSVKMGMGGGAVKRSASLNMPMIGTISGAADTSSSLMAERLPLSQPTASKTICSASTVVKNSISSNERFGRAALMGMARPHGDDEVALSRGRVGTHV